MNLKPLIWKELCENVKLLPIGLIVVGLICWNSMPSLNGSDPLIATILVGYLAIAVPLLAFALGVVQSYRDLQPAARAYLTHRRVTESEIFLSKTIAGFLIYMTGITIPLAALAGLIAIQGMNTYAMRPAQTIPGLVFALTAFAMHPAAIMMMARCASWWGTRSFPLAVASGLLVLMAQKLRTGGLFWAVIGGIIAVISLMCLIWIARQAWLDYANDPPASRLTKPNRRRWLLPGYLLLCTFVGTVAAVGFAVGLIETLSRPSVYVPAPYNAFAVNAKSGEPWLMTYLEKFDEIKNQYRVVPIGGDVIRDGKTVNPLKELGDNNNFIKFNYFSNLFRNQSSQSDGFFSRLNNGGYGFAAYDNRGYLLDYGTSQERRWRRTIAADGVYKPGRFDGIPFTLNPQIYPYSVFPPLYGAGYKVPLIDNHGVYFMADNFVSIRKVIDRQIDAAIMVQGDLDSAPRLLLRSENRLFEYKFVDATGSESWYQRPDPDKELLRYSTLESLGLEAELVETIKLPDIVAVLPNLNVAATADGFAFAKPSVFNRVYQVSTKGDLQTIEYKIEPGTLSPTVTDDKVMLPLAMGLIPGSMWSIVGIAYLWDMATDEDAIGLTTIIVTFPLATTVFCITWLIATVAAFVLVAYMARRRDLQRGQMIAWYWSVPILGLVAPLAIVAIYRIVYREPCAKCDKPRRVDETLCAHCGAEWQPPASEGIEITDRESVPLALNPL